MVMCFWYLVKVTFLVDACTLAYIGKVTFYKVPEHHTPYIITVSDY